MGEPTLEELANRIDGWTEANETGAHTPHEIRSGVILQDHGPRIAAALREHATNHVGCDLTQDCLHEANSQIDTLQAYIAKLEKVVEAAKGVIQDSCDCDQCCEFRFALAALEENDG